MKWKQIPLSPPNADPQDTRVDWEIPGSPPMADPQDDRVG